MSAGSLMGLSFIVSFASRLVVAGVPVCLESMAALRAAQAS
jgi:hypothetical protein